ncbi:hypothetical protein KRP22_007093 [Phytophthora ramorum]|nr:hypothetical protein KRP22_1810 [Phytophthora ramorum]
MNSEEELAAEAASFGVHFARGGENGLPNGYSTHTRWQDMAAVAAVMSPAPSVPCSVHELHPLRFLLGSSSPGGSSPQTGLSACSNA